MSTSFELSAFTVTINLILLKPTSETDKSENPTSGAFKFKGGTALQADRPKPTKPVLATAKANVN
jgi:hypothetical protein